MCNKLVPFAGDDSGWSTSMGVEAMAKKRRKPEAIGHGQRLPADGTLTLRNQIEGDRKILEVIVLLAQQNQLEAGKFEAGET